MRKSKMIRTGVLALILACAGALSFSLSANFKLLWEGTYANDVYVSWNDSTREMTVSYVNSKDYFEITDINEGQDSKLFRKSSSGMQEVSGVITKVVARKDSRRSNNKDYGTVVLKFYKNGSPYQFENGDYAVEFNIIGCRHRHSSKTPFSFTVRQGSSPSSGGSSSSTTTSSSSSTGCDFGLEPGDSIKLLSGTWKSSNTSVIVISKKGKATAVGEGTATLTSSTGQKLVIKVEED